jgi:multidrug efflux pump subunit AcrB
MRALLALTVLLVACRSPPPSRTRVVVAVAWPGASPAEVEAGVLQPLEEALAQLPGVRRIHAEATPAMGVLVLDTSSGVDEVRARVDETSRRIPANAGPPSVQVVRATRTVRWWLGAPTAAALAAASDDLRALVEREAGVTGVSVCGRPEDQVRVLLDPAHLAARQLTALDVVAAVERTGAVRAEGVRDAPVTGGHRIGDVAMVEAALEPQCHAWADRRGMLVTITLRPEAVTPVAPPSHRGAEVRTLDAGLHLVGVAGPEADGSAIAAALARELPGSRPVLVLDRERSPPALELFVRDAPAGGLARALRLLARHDVHAVRLAWAEPRGDGPPRRTVELDRDRVASLGLAVRDVLVTAELAGTGLRVADRDVVIALAPGSEAGQLLVRAADGHLVPLAGLVRTTVVPGEAPIRRVDRQRVPSE